jgi:hypothetical protein
MLHPFAHMGITGMHRTLARLTATTGRTGSMAVCLLGLDLGSAALEEVTGAAEASDEADLADVDLVDADLTGAAALDVAAGSEVAAASEAVMDSAAAGSVVAMAVDSTAALEADFTVAVDFTAVAAGSMVVVEAMEADTGN